jgi:hypothetical protein
VDGGRSWWRRGRWYRLSGRVVGHSWRPRPGPGLVAGWHNGTRRRRTSTVDIAVPGSGLTRRRSEAGVSSERVVLGPTTGATGPTTGYVVVGKVGGPAASGRSPTGGSWRSIAGRLATGSRRRVMPKANEPSPAPHRAATPSVGTQPGPPNRRSRKRAQRCEPGATPSGHAPDPDQDLDDQTEAAGSE